MFGNLLWEERLVAKSRDKMIASAARLLHEKGYHASGLSEIIQRSGAPRGSFYYYFPQGKDQLVREAILWSRRRLLSYLGEKMRQAPDGHEAFRVLADEAIAQLEATDYKLGCPFAISGLESPSDEVREECAEAFLEVQQLLEEQLRRVVSPERAAELAPFIFSSFQGALVVSQTMRDASALQAFKLQIPLHLK